MAILTLRITLALVTFCFAVSQFSVLAGEQPVCLVSAERWMERTQLMVKFFKMRCDCKGTKDCRLPHDEWLQMTQQWMKESLDADCKGPVAYEVADKEGAVDAKSEEPKKRFLIDYSFGNK